MASCLNARFNPASLSAEKLLMRKNLIQGMLPSLQRLGEAICQHASVLIGIALMTMGSLEKIDAVTIGIDLGSSQVLTGESNKISFAGLNGTSLVGNASVDLLFGGNKFVRLFSNTSPAFSAVIILQTNGLGIPGFLQGTGYLIDARGNAIPGVGVTGSASGDDGTLSIGLFPLLRDKTGAPNTGVQRPVDFYGVHFDITFPSLPLSILVGGQFVLTGNGQPFGIGPGVPADNGSPTPTPLSLANISTRGFVQTGDNVLIGGFIISGTQNKRVLLRAIGPSLSVANKLINPVLELHDRTGALIAINDNWGDANNHQEIANTGAAPANALESAIAITLAPGPYTAIVRGAGNTSGVALVEGYDLDGASASKFINISTRGVVQSGDNVMIGGFILRGSGSQKVVVRAIGPSLPVPGQLANPSLALHDAQGTAIASNDYWRATQQAEIAATGLSPTNDLEAAIARTLAPGPYTAIVRGINGSTGLALVEVYAVN